MTDQLQAMALRVDAQYRQRRAAGEDLDALEAAGLMVSQPADAALVAEAAGEGHAIAEGERIFSFTEDGIAFIRAAKRERRQERKKARAGGTG